jgi:NAD(P)H dehydrogenase (quinone)
MRILVTGASGPFGGAAARALMQIVPPNQLILMSRKPAALSELAQAGCEVRYGDFEKPASVEAAALGAERTLMISGHKVGYRIEQHSNTIDAAKRAGVKRIVYTSYYGSDADNTAMVCQDHYGTEQKLMSSGLHWTALRDGMYADTMANAAVPLALRTGKWFTCSDGGKVSFVDRNDCVACAVVALTQPGHENRIYNITGTDLWSFLDVADLATQLTGKPIDVINLSATGLYEYLQKLGIPRDSTQEFNKDGFAWSCDDIVSFEREMAKGKFAIKSQDIKLLTGREPKTFRSFMTERVAQLRQDAAPA